MQSTQGFRQVFMFLNSKFSGFFYLEESKHRISELNVFIFAEKTEKQNNEANKILYTEIGYGKKIRPELNKCAFK